MKQQRGFALIAALLVMVVVVILVFGTAFTTMIDRAISANQRAATDAYYVARAGVEKYKTAAFQAFRYYLDHIDLYNDDLSSGNPACGNFLSIGLDLNRNGVLGDEEDLIDGKAFFGIPEGNGTYDIKFEVAGKYIVLTSVGHVGRARSTVQLVAQPRNAGALSYAIFAGDGQQNKFINGGASIYGSVYVEGDPGALSDGDTSNDYVIDSNGDFSMHNYYTESIVQDLIKANPKKVNVRDFLKLNAIEQKDLCGALRVNHGKVALSGSSLLGDGSAPNGGYKATLAGVHVNEAYDTDVALTGGAGVYADIKSGIDIDGIPFPVLDTNEDNETFCDKDRAADKTWRECLREDAENTLADTEAPDRRGLVVERTAEGYSIIDPYSRVAMANPCDLDALFSSDSPDTIVFGTTSADCVGTDSLGREVGFSYEYDSSKLTGTLKVYGLVNFRGFDLHFSEDIIVRFEKKAAMFVETQKRDGSGQVLSPATPIGEAPEVSGGNVTLDGDLLPTTSFPDADVLGIIAERTIDMTGARQNLSKDDPAGQVAAGVFYAGEMASVQKDATVFGTIMAPRFSTSSNEKAGQNAKFVQVPGLEYNLAPGLSQLDNAAVPTYRIASFERR